VRVELLRVGNTGRRYAARFWRTEHFRLPPTFPQDANGQPRDDSSDELILVDWSHFVEGNWTNYTAINAEHALRKALRAVSEGVTRVTGAARSRSRGRRRRRNAMERREPG
jgi:hypothetical protein